MQNDQILLLCGSQIVAFDSNTLNVNDEILLESQIEAFKFDNVTKELILKQSDNIGDLDGVSSVASVNSLTENPEQLDNTSDNTDHCENCDVTVFNTITSKSIYSNFACINP